MSFLHSVETLSVYDQPYHLFLAAGIGFVVGVLGTTIYFSLQRNQ